jgi:sterol desaturase/sphingolipid hydroxylase (fatty acid hydroxylase superfamily)
LNFASAYRLGWTGTLTGTPLFFLPLVWLGFPPMLVIAALGINLLYQFWLHSEWIPKLGWLEWILNTPSHHRVHHAANANYLDTNFGGIVIVFDRLFGTLVVERPDIPCRYGLVKPLRSYNPLYVAFHEWLAMLRDLRSARSLREFSGYLFGKPGWRPDGRGATTLQLQRAMSRR